MSAPYVEEDGLWRPVAVSECPYGEGQELSGIAEAAGSGADQALRLKRHFTLEEIVNAAAWLAGDLVEAPVKIASGQDPNPVMASDLARKIRDAEIRLEIIREIGKSR